MGKRNVWWLAVVVLVGAGCATARAGETWRLLGQRAIEYRLDRDEIVVGADEGRFHQLQLRVRSAPVTLRDLKVHFADGSVQDVAIRKRIPAGGESRVIDLAGGERVLQKVVFWYDTPRRRSGRAVVQLYGR